jgi:hypothetical protein
MKYGVKRGTWRPCRAGVLKETESGLASCQYETVKPNQAKKARDKAALAAVTKEMRRPRFAESARAHEEAAAHPVPNRTKKPG